MDKHQNLQPAEWDFHRAVWMAWPSHSNLWEENLEPAQIEFTELCRAIASTDSHSKEVKAEMLEILVPSEAQMKLASSKLDGLPLRFHLIPFGDVWLRDTAPIFVKNNLGQVLPASFKFNGWGEKYLLPFDDKVAANISTASGKQGVNFDFVLEGGSVDVDGLGTGLTTEQCLLNKNRNPHLNKKQIESLLAESLGLKKIIWLNEGLINDHTDGHIDTIARFIAPGKVVCMQSHDLDDPNHEILEKIANDLKGQTDAQGRLLEVIRIPSPGIIRDEEGELMPASYVNFYIGNASVIVPTYGSPNDAAAVAAISELFPNRKTIGCSAIAILSGGGAFHCITQQEPLQEKL